MKRIIALLLAVSLVAALIVPVNAADSQHVARDVLIDSNFLSSMDARFSVLSSVDKYGFTKAALWEAMDYYVSRIGVGCFDSLASLERAAGSLRSLAKLDGRTLGEAFVELFVFVNPFADWEVVSHPEYGYVIAASNSGLVLCNSAGAFPYYKEGSTSSGSSDTVGGGRWLGSRSCDINGKVVLLTEDVLANLCVTLNGSGQSCTLATWGNTYKVIQKDNYYYYCNPDGLPYVARIDEGSHVVNNSNNYYTENSGDNVYNEGDTVNNNLIDNSSSTVWFPDGTLNYIDQLIYDGSTKTYHVDAHEEYNTTNNTYVSNSYTYQYHIDYTSITYIGQTEEYEETYKYYYQLPDGRSSADLTKEDLEQLSLSFKDVVNYARSADDLTQRVLYHFDGNTSDASYWSYLSDFYWDYGSSLTFMDEGVFGGSLYLDETPHEFTIRLPSVADVSGDFTLQFRYYQSHTAAPVADSYIKIGDTKFLTFTGAVYQDKTGADLCSTQVGSWNEICIMRKDGVVYYYINGVCQGSMADSTHYSNSIRFYFGSEQQTYKKLDELRFTRAAVYDAGKNYTVSSVPFDSNLTLVLPSGESPLADETVKLVPAKDNILTQYGLDDWTTAAVRDRLEPYSEPLSSYAGGTLYYNPGYVALKDNPASLGVTVSGSSDVGGGFFLPVIYDDYTYFPEDDDFEQYYTPVSGFQKNKDYTLTVYLEDGSYSYVSFHVGNTGSPRLSSVCDFAGIDFKVKYDRYQVFSATSEWTLDTYGIIICPPLNTEINIVYMELVEDSFPHFTTEYEYAIYSSGQLAESPVLAVKSSVDVTSYQFGGVRPSYPEVGQVWALVENSRISSLQQYTGYAWESVDGRIWTGERWVPLYAYDVLLLKDMYDIIEADPSQDFIYTQEGFWSWLQKAWAQMLDKLDQIIDGLSGKNPDDPFEDCEHVYSSKVDRDPGCVDPGLMIYTCDKCGHSYTELIDATGHDWVVTEHVDPVPVQSSSSSGPVMYATRSGPVITQQPEDTTAVDGDTVYFTVEANGAEPLTYQWQWKYVDSNADWASSAMAGAATDTLIVPANMGRNNCAYRCKIIDTYGSVVYSDAAVLTVEALVVLEITSQPENIAATDGDTVYFTVEANGAEPLTYQWQYQYVDSSADWAPSAMAGATTNTLIVPANMGRNNCAYRCAITDANGIVLYSNAAVLTVRPPITITAQPEPVFALLGETATFSVSAVGKNLTYQWQWQYVGSSADWANSSLEGTNTATLVVPVTTNRNDCAYRCIITDALGNSVQTDAVTLTVYLEHGYDVLTCTKCGATCKDYGDGPEEEDYDLFDALGDFLAEGIEWLLDLLTDLVDSLSGIIDTFRGYIEKVGVLAGTFPAFFGAFMAIVPEDLRLLLWFALVGFVALTIWRKITK